MVYQKLQSYSKTAQWTQRQERVEIGRRITRSVWRTKGEDNKSTDPCSSKERRKIQSGNWCIRICNRRGSITRTRGQMETYYILVKNNITSRTKLWDIWQRITHNSGSHYKVETIFIRCYREIWSLNRSWKSQIFLGTTQTQWKTS